MISMLAMVSTLSFRLSGALMIPILPWRIIASLSGFSISLSTMLLYSLTEVTLEATTIPYPRTAKDDTISQRVAGV